MSSENKVVEGVTRFFKGLFFGIFFVVAIMATVNWLFFRGDSVPAQQPVQQVAQQQIDISVASQAVKMVGGKYRYFFNIRNNDTNPFVGDVNIAIVNTENKSVYDRTFSASQPIASGIGNSVYFDANTGPTSVHGAYGVQTYSYTAKVGGQIVKTGSGSISAIVE
jgi:hypothetical protein